MENTGVLVSRKLTYEFTYKDIIWTIEETENMMEYDIEVFDVHGETPTHPIHWEDVLEAFSEARENGLINDFE